MAAVNPFPLPPSCFESRFFVLAEWLRNHPTPRTLSSLWKTLNHSVVVCAVCAVAVTHDTHPERGWSEGKIQPWELQETSRRISGKRVYRVSGTPPQSTESRNLRKLSNGGTVLEIRSPKKSSALCALVDSVSFPSNGPPPLSPSGRHSSLLHFFSVCSTWDCLQIANPSKVGFARKKKNSVQFTQPPLCEENKEGLLLCHAAEAAAINASS